MFQNRVPVLWNRQLNGAYFRLAAACPDTYDHAVAGQFVMLRLPDRSAPLLRRPFSIHRIIRQADGGPGIELLYRVVGPTTRAMSALKPGEVLDLIGPMGRGFSFAHGIRKAYVAGGGVGVAPLYLLVEQLLARHLSPEDISVFIGGRTRDDLMCGDDFTRLGVAVTHTTDDGSAGDQCLVTHPLEQAMRVCRPDILYACGPPGMLSCVADMAEALDVPCQISIETMMGCGMGACLGCAVESRTETGRYLHACLDGPVFDARRLRCNFH